MPLDVELLTKVRDHILADPRRYEQTVWIEDAKSLGVGRMPPCGTVACIAGWTMAIKLGMSGKEFLKNEIPSERLRDIAYSAREALGLDYDVAEVLFSGNPSEDWPPPFNEMWANSESKEGDAKVAAALIDHIIRSDGDIECLGWH